MAYTAGDFEALAASFSDGGIVGLSNRDLVVAALRIASAVMRPGVLEDALANLILYEDPERLIPDAAFLRRDLIEAKP
jgi:hypothetical protein